MAEKEKPDINKYLWHHTAMRKKYGNPHILYQKEKKGRDYNHTFTILDNEDNEYIFIYNRDNEIKYMYGVMGYEIEVMAISILERIASEKGKIVVIKEVDV